LKREAVSRMGPPNAGRSGEAAGGPPLHGPPGLADSRHDHRAQEGRYGGGRELGQDSGHAVRARDVARRDLPHLADALEFADVERVEAEQFAGPLGLDVPVCPCRRRQSTCRVRWVSRPASRALWCSSTSKRARRVARPCRAAAKARKSFFINSSRTTDGTVAGSIFNRLKNAVRKASGSAPAIRLDSGRRRSYGCPPPMTKAVMRCGAYWASPNPIRPPADHPQNMTALRFRSSTTATTSLTRAA